MQQIHHKEATIYVPVEGSYLDKTIIPGSGIVGIPTDGVMKIYLEGNKYGASNLNSPEDRIACAFGRLATRYPTSALIGVFEFDKDQLVEVGAVSWPNEIHILPEKREIFDAYMARYQFTSSF